MLELKIGRRVHRILLRSNGSAKGRHSLEWGRNPRVSLFRVLLTELGRDPDFREALRDKQIRP